MIMLCKPLFVLLSLVIVSTVLLRFTTTDYPFAILKLFLHNKKIEQRKLLQYKPKVRQGKSNRSVLHVPCLSSVVYIIPRTPDLRENCGRFYTE
jgi:hypothetical protein